MHEIFGFALWWECTLAPNVVLSTSPHAPRTHWEQIYLPVLEPIAAQAGDDITFQLDSETGGNESGIEVRWAVAHLRNGERVLEQTLSIADGFLA